MDLFTYLEKKDHTTCFSVVFSFENFTKYSYRGIKSKMYEGIRVSQ